MFDAARLRAVLGRGFQGPARPGLKIALDLAVFASSVAAAYIVRFEAIPPEPYRSQLWALLLLLPAVRLTAGWLFGVHRSSWRLFGLPEAIVLVQSIATVTVILLLTRLVVPWFTTQTSIVVPLGVIMLEGFFTLSGAALIRVAARLLDEQLARQSAHTTAGMTTRRALLVGAGRAGRMAARELRHRPDAGYDPIGFLDDAPARKGQIIEGVRVLGTTREAKQIAESVGAETLILTMPSTPRARMRKVVERCREADLPVQTVPGLYELIGGRVGITKIRPVRIEDLLGRDVVEFDEQVRDLVLGSFRGKRVLVTGAGGSIGSELCRQLAEVEPQCLILFEANEGNLFEIEQEIRRRLGDRAVPCLADVRSPLEVERCFDAYRPDVVFHAAAYKHVPMMESHPVAAIENNVRGTKVIAQAAGKWAIERFLLISTDKAVNPTSVMGASKRVAEMIVQTRNDSSRTRFCVCRFGNVLGSRGSVLDTFRRQIEEGGPVTVTHPDVTRFFMTIPEAVRLVIQACAIADGGEIFMLEMGEPVRILDMAKQMIELAGFSEDEIPIGFVGLRPGEKLHEELLRLGEEASPSEVAGILLAKATSLPRADVDGWVAHLEELAATGDVEAIRAELATTTGYQRGGIRPSAEPEPLGLHNVAG